MLQERLLVFSAFLQDGILVACLILSHSIVGYYPYDCLPRDWGFLIAFVSPIGKGGIAASGEGQTPYTQHCTDYVSGSVLAACTHTPNVEDTCSVLLGNTERLYCKSEGTTRNCGDAIVVVTSGRGGPRSPRGDVIDLCKSLCGRREMKPLLRDE